MATSIFGTVGGQPAIAKQVPTISSWEILVQQIKAEPDPDRRKILVETAREIMDEFKKSTPQLIASGPLMPPPSRNKQVRFKNITMQGNPGISEEMAYQLLAGRLRISEYEVMPFAHISMHMTPEKAILFVVAQGGPVIIEDPMELYPSDSLVTQLRMLIG